MSISVPAWQVGLAGAALGVALSLPPSMYERRPLYQAPVSALAGLGGFAVGAAAGALVNRLAPSLAGGRTAVQAAMIGVGLAGVAAPEIARRLTGGESPAAIDALSSAAILVGAGGVAGFIAQGARAAVGAGIARTGLAISLPAPGTKAKIGAAVAGTALVGGAGYGFLRLQDAMRYEPAPPIDRSKLRKVGDTWTPREALDVKGIEFVDGASTSAPRVYGSVFHGDTVEERAVRVVRELERVGAFDKKRIVFASPTGSGWVNPIALYAMEQMDDDVAFAALQYGTGSSKEQVLKGQVAAASLTALMKEAVAARERLYPNGGGPEFVLYGESMGAGAALDALEDVGKGDVDAGMDAMGISRSLFVGRPGTSPSLADDAPQKVRRITDIDHVREIRPHDMSGIRALEFSNADDIITNFAPDLLWRKPDWLRDPRPSTIAPDQFWFPGITWLHALSDLEPGVGTAGRLGAFDDPRVHDYRPYIPELVRAAYGMDANRQTMERIGAEVREQFADKGNIPSQLPRMAPTLPEVASKGQW